MNEEEKREIYRKMVALSNNQMTAGVAKGNRRSMGIRAQTNLEYLQTIETLNTSLQQQNQQIQLLSQRILLLEEEAKQRETLLQREKAPLNDTINSFRNQLQSLESRLRDHTHVADVNKQWQGLVRTQKSDDINNP